MNGRRREIPLTKTRKKVKRGDRRRFCRSFRGKSPPWLEFSSCIERQFESANEGEGGCSLLKPKTNGDHGSSCAEHEKSRRKDRYYIQTSSQRYSPASTSTAYFGMSGLLSVQNSNPTICLVAQRLPSFHCVAYGNDFLERPGVVVRIRERFYLNVYTHSWGCCVESLSLT